MRAPQEQLSVRFAALADPTRRDLLVRLRPGPATVTDLAANYAVTRVAVSQHLTVLEKAGLITRIPRGRWIDCQFSPSALDPAAAWIAAQQAEWHDRLDRLEAHLIASHPPYPLED